MLIITIRAQAACPDHDVAACRSIASRVLLLIDNYNDATMMACTSHGRY